MSKAAPVAGSDVALCVTIIAAAALSFLELMPGGVRAEAVIPFIQLTFAAFVLCIAGWSISVLAGLRLFEGHATLYIGVAQLVLVVYVYIRSAADAMCLHMFDLALPVTGPELAILVTGLVWAAHRRNPLSSIRSALPGFAWVTVAIFIVAQRELPRELMLSSDPDQHLFFASQILKFGAIPFHQGSFGPEDFHYPAGFAALAALWSWLGAAPASNVVTSAPLLQSLLAVLGIANLCSHVVAKDDRRLDFVAAFFALLLFFSFFPFTLEEQFYYLAKTGSISTLLSLIVTLVLAAQAKADDAHRALAPALLLAGLGVAVLVLINPIAAIVPAIVLGLVVLRVLWHARKTPRSLVFVLLLYCITPMLVVLADPYYLHLLVTRHALPPMLIAEVPISQGSLAEVAVARFAQMIRPSGWIQPFLLRPYFGWNALSLVVGGSAVCLVLYLIGRSARKRALAFITVVCAFILVLELTLAGQYSLREF